MDNVFCENITTGETFKIISVPSGFHTEVPKDASIVLQNASTGKQIEVTVQEYENNYRQVGVGLVNLLTTNENAWE